MLIDILWAIAWEARIHQESFEYCGGLALANSQMPSYLLTPSLNRTGGINRTNKKEKFISWEKDREIAYELLLQAK